jgi:YegS/Rv2252/BmrU family lipid kinase
MNTTGSPSPTPAGLKHIHVIVNPVAGQDAPILNVLNSVLQPAGITWEVFVTQAAGDAKTLAQQAVAAGVDAVAVYGGDGTVTEAASGLIGTPMPLAILPGGTANVMSIELGIPGALADAAALVCDPTHGDRLVDMGMVGDRHFLGHVAIGLEAEMHQAADRALKDRFGLLAYPIAVLQSLADRPTSHYALTIDDEKIEMDVLDCMVTNLGSVGVLGASFAQNISVDDGLLDVILVRKADLTSLGELIGSLSGSTDPAKLLPHWQARKVSVDADPPQQVTADGEVLGTTPVVISVLPGAVHIIVPAPAEPQGTA